MIKAILAHGLNYEIGEKGDLPWGKGLPKDLEYFKKVTNSNKVIMGNTTFKSLPFKKGFPNRVNYVICSQSEHNKDETYLYHIPLERVKAMLKFGFGNEEWDHNYYIVGGASIYEQLWDYVDEVHITTVEESYPNADTFFKPDLSLFEKKGLPLDVSGDNIKANVQVWSRIKS